MQELVESEEVILDNDVNFFQDKLDEVLITTRNLCLAIKSLIESKSKDSNEFVQRINRKYKTVKGEIAELSKNEMQARFIRSKISFKRICLTSILEFEEDFNFDSDNDEDVEIFKMIGEHYIGGIVQMKIEHSDLHDDIKLIHVEGIVTKSKNTTFNTPYITVYPPKKVNEKEMIKNFIVKFLLSLVPWVSWFPGYFKNWRTTIKGDIIAGATVGVMAIPQTMGYAVIAGLPPVYGLYSSIVPLFMYAIFGTSREIKIGATAVLTTLLSQTLTDFGKAGTEEYIKSCLFLALLAGVILMVMGILRLGFVTNFLSHSLLGGLISAAGFIIIMGQIKTLFGVKPQDSNAFWDQLVYFLRVIKTTNGPTLAIAIVSMVVLQSYEMLKNKWKWLTFVPVALILMIISTAMSYKLNFAAKGISVVGSIPPGLPKPTLPTPTSPFSDYIGTAFVIAMISFVEHISIATKFADITGYKIKPSQELFSLGISNFLGSFFSSMPITGSFSRTAVNAKAGAKSPLSNCIAAVIVMICVLTLTKSINYLPKVVLSSIVCVAGASIIDFAMIFKLWKENKKEVVVWIVSFVFTLSLSVEYGLLAAVITSVLLLLLPIWVPRIMLLGRLPGKNSYRSVQYFPYSLVNPKIAVVRIDSSICFLNGEHICKKFKHLMDKTNPKIIIMDWSSINSIDSSAVYHLKNVFGEAKKKGIIFIFSQVKTIVSKELRRSGLMDYVKPEHFFWELHHAALYAGKVLKKIERMEKKKTKLNEQKEVGDQNKGGGNEELREEDRKFSASEIEIEMSAFDDKEHSGEYSPLIFGDELQPEKQFNCQIF